MSFEARVLTVLIASPGDVKDARKAVEDTILSWNRDRARQERVVLLPLRWEIDAVPSLADDAQGVINKQLVDESDVVVALFHSRLGAPTERADSGTAEEIERALSNDSLVHVYFSRMPLPPDLDTDELERLRSFKEQLQGKGLLGDYASLEDLTAKVRTALEADVAQLVAPPGDEATTGSAVLRATYEFDREPSSDSKGRMKYSTKRERLLVQNIGTANAEAVKVNIQPVGRGEAPSFILQDPIECIPPNGSVNIHLLMHMGVAQQWRVTFDWREGDMERSESQTVLAY